MHSYTRRYLRRQSQYALQFKAPEGKDLNGSLAPRLRKEWKIDKE